MVLQDIFKSSVLCSGDYYSNENLCLEYFADLYYSGESSTELAHSLTCPICGRLGFTESELQSHVTLEHQNSNTEVVRNQIE